MAFCKNCGNEHDSNAFVCIECGCLVDNPNQKKIAREANRQNEIFKTLSLIFSVVSLSVWLAYIFTGRVQLMYDWAFWLSFSVTMALSLCGLCFGILTKDKLCYSLNTAACVFILFIMLSLVVK